MLAAWAWEPELWLWNDYQKIKKLKIHMEVKKMKKKITVEGMHCASCATNIERSLKKISGVESAKVSMMTRKAIIEADEKVTDEELKKAVARAGYKAISIE
nr:hypothetical protein [uncultured archaeon]